MTTVGGLHETPTTRVDALKTRTRCLVSYQGLHHFIKLRPPPPAGLALDSRQERETVKFTEAKEIPTKAGAGQDSFRSVTLRT